MALFGGSWWPTLAVQSDKWPGALKMPEAEVDPEIFQRRANTLR